MQHKGQHRRFKKNGDSIVVEFTRFISKNSMLKDIFLDHHRMCDHIIGRYKYSSRAMSIK